MNETIAVFCVKAYTFLLPISWIGVAIVVLVLLPLALFKTTRSAAGTGMLFSSYLFGLTTWFLGATVTFVTWGWVGLIIGFIIAGVGVIPIGILAAFISLKEPTLGFSLIVMVVIVFVTRMGGMALTQSGSEVKNNQVKALFPANNQVKQGIASNTQSITIRERTTQLQGKTHHKPTIENKATSDEKAILKELRNESILTSNEFIEKMAVVEAREEAERFEKLLCSITEPFINKISKLKNLGLLNEQEYEQKKRKIIEKHRAELLNEQEQKKKKLAMIKNVISEDDYHAMNAQAFDYLDIIDKKKKLGLIKTQDEETNEIFRLQEIHQELVECNEICFKCDAFRKPSDEKCSACGQIFNKE